MPFKAGVPRAPGAGRKKGSLNKRTNTALEILAEHKFDPLRELIECYHRCANTDEVMHIAVKCLDIMMPYVYPKLTPPKEGTSETNIFLIQQIEEMAKRPKNEIIDVVKKELKQIEGKTE